jgi:imidazolonepropionase-like amidohydrolase
MFHRAARFVLIVTAATASHAGAQNLVITNARIVVGNGTVVPNGAVVVRDGRIVSAGPAAPAGAQGQMIDAGGMTVMPGFIDAHRHIINGNDEQWFREQAAIRMREFLEAGYTTLMSGGGPVPGIIRLKERVEAGQLIGPRIITSGRVDPPGFKTPEAARAQVQAMAKAGVEIIKARIDPDANAHQRATLAAITDEARKHKLDVMVHAVSVPAMLAAVEAGATKLVHTPHGSWLSEADAKRVAAAGIETLSTAGFGLPVFGVFNKNNVPTFRDGSPWPSGILDGQGRGREAGEKAVNGRTLFDAGVVYGFGTDTNYLPREGLKHELRALTLMFSAQDIIKIMGPNSAAFLDRGADLGTLEPGKLADIVIVNGDPLELIYNVLNVRVTIKGGRIVHDARNGSRKP